MQRLENCYVTRKGVRKIHFCFCPPNFLLTFFRPPERSATHRSETAMSFVISHKTSKQLFAKEQNAEFSLNNTKNININTKNINTNTNTNTNTTNTNTNTNTNIDNDRTCQTSL